jgi:hypothetical protein
MKVGAQSRRAIQMNGWQAGHMDKKTLYRTIEELRQQCRFAQVTFQSLRLRLNELDQERVFVYVHAFLGHAVMISRLLWPARESSAERGETLRKELSVPADSALRLSGGREQVERFDEAYEDWLAGLSEADYVDQNLMPTGTMAGSKADVFQRSLDPDMMIFQLRGQPIPLRKVSDAIRVLEGATQQWLRTHQPW